MKVAGFGRARQRPKLQRQFHQHAAIEAPHRWARTKADGQAPHAPASREYACGKDPAHSCAARFRQRPANLFSRIPRSCFCRRRNSRRRHGPSGGNRRGPALPAPAAGRAPENPWPSSRDWRPAWRRRCAHRHPAPSSAKAISPAFGDAMRGGGIDHPHLGIFDQRHRLARRVIGQAQDHHIGFVERTCPARASFLRSLSGNVDKFEIGARAKTLADLQTRGAHRSINENPCRHDANP